MAREETSKSKLIKLLQRISHGATPRIGLVPMKEQAVPALALMVAPDKADAKVAHAAIGAGADALVVKGGEITSLWSELAGAAGDKPVGAHIGGQASPDNLREIAGRADFVIADVAQAPAALLELKDAAKILAVDEDCSAQFIRTLGELPIDAVVAQSKPGADGVLTVRDVLHFRQAVDLVRKPVIAIVDQRFSTSLLPLLREMGVEAILLQLAASADVATVVGEYRKAIDGLGKPIGRAREHGQALVPRLSMPGQPAQAEPEEEPDDE